MFDEWYVGRQRKPGDTEGERERERERGGEREGGR